MCHIGEVTTLFAPGRLLAFCFEGKAVIYELIVSLELITNTEKIDARMNIHMYGRTNREVEILIQISIKIAC